MPVGGIKEKVLAAARAGIRHLVLPTRNADDLREIPADIRRSLSVKRVRDIDTALDWIFRDVKPAGRGDG
jgi:ATP-dependent Lon protease